MGSMKKLIVVLFFLQTIFVQGMNQKMILSTHIETADAAKSLYEVTKFFHEDTQAKKLKIKHQLSLQLELLEAYVLVTIKPIRLTSVKNELKYLFHGKFPQHFSVDDTPMLPVVLEKKVQKQEKVLKIELIPEVNAKVQKVHTTETKDEVSMYQTLKLFWQGLDNEWLGLLFLALAGFLLIFRSASQIEKIKVLQKEVEKHQRRVENEIVGIGEKRE